MSANALTSPSALNSRHHSPESPATPRPESETKFSPDPEFDEMVRKELEFHCNMPENQQYYEREGLCWPGERRTVNSPSQTDLDEGMVKLYSAETRNQQLVIRTAQQFTT